MGQRGRVKVRRLKSWVEEVTAEGQHTLPDDVTHRLEAERVIQRHDDQRLHEHSVLRDHELHAKAQQTHHLC